MKMIVLLLMVTGSLLVSCTNLINEPLDGSSQSEIIAYSSSNLSSSHSSSISSDEISSSQGHDICPAPLPEDAQFCEPWMQIKPLSTRGGDCEAGYYCAGPDEICGGRSYKPVCASLTSDDEIEVRIVSSSCYAYAVGAEIVDNRECEELKCPDYTYDEALSTEDQYAVNSNFLGWGCTVSPVRSDSFSVSIVEESRTLSNDVVPYTSTFNNDYVAVPNELKGKYTRIYNDSLYTKRSITNDSVARVLFYVLPQLPEGFKEVLAVSINITGSDSECGGRDYVGDAINKDIVATLFDNSEVILTTDAHGFLYIPDKLDSIIAFGYKTELVSCDLMPCGGYDYDEDEDYCDGGVVDSGSSKDVTITNYQPVGNILYFEGEHSVVW